jgi:hypothetical protein
MAVPGLCRRGRCLWFAATVLLSSAATVLILSTAGMLVEPDTALLSGQTGAARRVGVPRGRDHVVDRVDAASWATLVTAAGGTAAVHDEEDLLYVQVPATETLRSPASDSPPDPVVRGPTTDALHLPPVEAAASEPDTAPTPPTDASERTPALGDAARVAAVTAVVETEEPTLAPTGPLLPRGPRRKGAPSAPPAAELRIFFVTIVRASQPPVLLERQLRHMRALGVPYTRMGVVVQVDPGAPPVDDRNSSTMTVREALYQLDEVQTRQWDGPFIVNGKVRELREMLKQLGFTATQLDARATSEPGEPHDWIVYADPDEFHQYPDVLPLPGDGYGDGDGDDSDARSRGGDGGFPGPDPSTRPLPRLLALLDAHEVGAVEGQVLDRVTAEGVLAVPDPAQSPFEQYPVGCELTKHIVRGIHTRLMAWRPTLIKAGDGSFSLHDRGAHKNHEKRVIGPTRGGWVHRFGWVPALDATTRAQVADAEARGVPVSGEAKRLTAYLDRQLGRIDVEPGQPSRCIPCSGPGGLAGIDDGPHALAPLTAAILDSAVVVLETLPGLPTQTP